MHITKLQSAAVGSVYICGAVAGALVFGHLSDRFGRKRLFVVIPLVYLGASVAATLCWSYATFAACVCAIGFGIGGEYAALNSALNEFIPARVRGTVDVVVNGTYWLGAGLAALASGPLFDEAVLPADAGWRTAYGLTAALGTAVVALRLYLPESPRWLVMQDRPEDAERVMREIEAAVARHTRRPLPACTHSVTVKVGMRASALRLLRILSCDYAGRSVLCLALMVSQAFFYNAIYFTYVSVLTVFQVQGAVRDAGFRRDSPTREAQFFKRGVPAATAAAGGRGPERGLHERLPKRVSAVGRTRQVLASTKWLEGDWGAHKQLAGPRHTLEQ